MEIIFELLLALLQIIAELVLQVVVEILAELGLHCMREPFQRPEPVHPVFAAIGYAMFGAIAGALSLCFFPVLFIAHDWLRIANLVLTPLAAGITMGVVGAWRSRRNEELIRLDHFGYGCLFALVMALVRYVGAR